MQPVDCVVHARWIAPVEPPAVLDHHALVIQGGRIIDCLPGELADARYQARERLVRPTHLVTPGFVNAQVDLAASLWRGIALAAPARYAGVPAGAAAEALTDSVTLGLAEQVASGITTSVDIGNYPALVGAIASSMGLRVVLGLAISDAASAFATGIDEHFDRALALHDEYRDHPLVRTAFVLRGLRELSDATLIRLRTLADQLERPVLVQADAAQAERLYALGLWNANTAVLHFGALPLASAAPDGVSVIHSPADDLEAARPLAPIARLASHGVNIALGSGAFPLARDACDMLRLSGRLAGLASESPRPRADALLRMATLGGARAVGLEESIGSLATGRRADFVSFDLGLPASSPVLDPLAALVACVGRDAVADVFVAGRAVVATGRPLALDLEELAARVSRHQASLLATGAGGARQ